MSEYTIRRARFSDISELAILHAKSFWDDALIGDWMNPHRNKYPQDFANHFLRRYRINFWQHNRIWLVSTIKEDNGKEIIVGSAQWERFGKGGDEMRYGILDTRPFWKAYYTAQMKVEDIFWPNRATENDLENMIDLAYPFINPIWSGERKESWYLEILGVLPDYQGKGVGRELVKWGLERAKEEDICASVISADGKDGFYLKVGFEEQFGSVGMGEGNPLAEAKGNMYWRMPKSSPKGAEI